jgi:hypothetical protein
MTQARGVAANFAVAQRQLSVGKTGSGTGTVTSSPAGINCGSTCAAFYDHGTNVVLTPIPGANSAFTGWSGGGCSGTGTCTVPMTAAQSVSADFTQTSYQLTVQINGGGTATIVADSGAINCPTTCTDSYPTGQMVQLTLTPTGGSSFAGWGGGGCTGTNPVCTVTMDQDRTIPAIVDPP